MPEHPRYRPYALLAFGAAVCVGTPVGLWLLAARYAGAPAVGVPWVLLHAHVQVLGFFGTLIVGVAPHLFARFAGRPLPARGAPTGAWLLAVALAMRVAGTAAPAAWLLFVAATLEAVVFTAFAARTWRALDATALAPLRRQLTAASSWLALAPLGELALRAVAVAHGAAGPAPGDLRALHVGALLGGVLGWVLGVLLRAGPMFVAGWTPSSWLTTAVPWLLGIGAVLSMAVETGGGLVPRIGELIVLATATAVLVSAGAFRRAGRTLPLAGRTGDERRLFKLAAACLLAATVGAGGNVAATAAGTGVPWLPDAVRHLLTIGVLGGVAIAMSFRLVPVLEGQALPWPSSRRVALVALAGAVLARSAEVLVPLHVPGARTVVIVSGGLAWVAFACVAVNLAGLAVRGGAAAQQ